jgi:hypothetical protein
VGDLASLPFPLPIAFCWVMKETKILTKDWFLV